MNTAKLYLFPHHTAQKRSSQEGVINSHRMDSWKQLLLWMIGLVWLLLALFWPLLNWIVAMDVVFQFVRALYYANTPGTHATLQASIHGVSYLLLSCFVYLYRPTVFKKI